MKPSLHRVLLAVVLVGNAIAFAGVDPVTRMATAAVVLVLAWDLRRSPETPAPVRGAAWGFAALAAVQLVPLPEGLRRLLQPGFADVMAAGWAPLSLAPWSTILVIGSVAMAAVVALTAARMAATRSGLPTLLGMIAVVCCVLAVLGLAGEGGAPDRVLLVRTNTGGGDVYGPFVNSNHFAVAMELSLPAALVLLAAAARHLPRPGATRQRAAVLALSSAVVGLVGVAALLRCSSRGGVLFLAAGLVIALPLWRRPARAMRWPWVVAFALLFAVSLSLAWTRLPELRDGFRQLLVVEGVEGNTRWDLWSGTLQSWQRSPFVGSGLGSYRHVIGLDKPATGASVLEQAHNDWLEWLSTAGLIGGAVLVLLLVGLMHPLRPRWVRRLRFELRYPLAGAIAAITSVALHELVGFGLQMPLNRYLLAAWLGLVWGAAGRVSGGRAGRVEEHDGEG